MKKAKILIVDDEVEYHELFKKRLEAEGHTVDGALNCAEAERMARENSYELIFIDYCLPGKNGTETCKLLKKMLPDTPIVFMTGKMDGELTERELSFQEAGGISTYFLYKPFSYGEILEIVDKALRNRER